MNTKDQSNSITPAVAPAQDSTQAVAFDQNDTIHNSVQADSNAHPANHTGDQDVSASDQPATNSINPEVVAKLQRMLTKATNSAFFMSNPKRVEALEAALNIPVSDDKSFQQFFNHAEKDLVADAYKKARKDGSTPVEVTNALIVAEAQRRYMVKHGKLALVNEEYMA